MKKEKTYSIENGLMTRDEFTELAQAHGSNCVSIFIPTERAGGPVDAGEGQIRLKNSLKEVRKTLEEKDLNAKEIGEILQPVEALLEKDQFWRNQSDGLAIFANGKEMNYYTLPVHFRQQNYVSDHFYMLPVIPYFNDDGRYFLLSLSAQHVGLFECTRHTITEIEVDDLTPGRLEDAVGYDYEEKTLQNRTGQGGESGAMFHGQGSGKDDKKVETEKFFREVDEGVMKVLNDKKAPLVLACVDEYYPIYSKVTSHPNLFEDHVSGNPDESDPLLLHEESWLLVEDVFKKERRKKAEDLQNKSAGKKASTDVREIIPAAVDGRVDTLFIEEGTDLFGVYDLEKRNVELAEPGDRMYHASLYNLAAVNTLLNSGQVFLSEEEEMPMKETELDALLRY